MVKMEMEKDLFTAKEAALLLGISDRHVRRLSMSEGDIEKAGRFYRIAGLTRADLNNPRTDIGHPRTDIGHEAFIILRDAVQSKSAALRKLEQDHREMIDQHRREKFSLKVMLTAAAVTVILAGSGAIIFHSMWQKGSVELTASENLLSVTRERAIRAESVQDDLQKDLTAAQKQNAEINARIVEAMRIQAETPPSIPWYKMLWNYSQKSD